MALRDEVLAFADGTLGCSCESVFKEYPSYIVLKHPLNGKWAGIIMDIPACNIGLSSREVIDIMNVKLDPLLVASLRSLEGYAPAWHMNKEHWLTIRLDGSVDFDNVAALLEMSFGLVGPKRKAKAKRESAGAES